MKKEFTDRFLPCICGREVFYRQREYGDWIAACSNLACDKMPTIIRKKKVDVITDWNNQHTQGGSNENHKS